ncbi:hypothetical protein [Paenibacillus wenxiniae]|uniref:Uncharacterized protein n=1 Tax=Paenibacillus wenxiniae TaxID=1636843 RepID=A0ABW4RK05_9BACL
MEKAENQAQQKQATQKQTAQKKMTLAEAMALSNQKYGDVYRKLADA